MPGRLSSGYQNAVIPLVRLRITPDLIELVPRWFLGAILPTVSMDPKKVDAQPVQRVGGQGIQFSGEFEHPGAIFWAMKRDMGSIEYALTEAGVGVARDYLDVDVED